MKNLAQERANIYRLFSNDKRLLIFWMLSKNEMSVNDIAEELGASIQNTSQHLRLMKANNFLKSRRNGNKIYYRVVDNEIGDFSLRNNN